MNRERRVWRAAETPVGDATVFATLGISCATSPRRLATGPLLSICTEREVPYGTRPPSAVCQPRPRRVRTGETLPIQRPRGVNKRDAVPPLSTHLTPEALIDLAGSRSYDRGWRYFSDGHVTALRHDAERASGTVLGTYPYEVRLRLKRGDLTWACSCPAAEDGSFCKHLVALSLAVWEETAGATGTDPHAGTPSGVPGPEALRAHLAAKPMDELVDLLVERALEDPRFEDRFRLEMARSDPDAPDLSAYRRVIDETTAVHDFIPYRGSSDYARGVEEAVAALGDLLADGHATAVIELTEHALRRLEHALGLIDDSSGLIRPLLDELEELHLAACERARPDPEALAQRLFERELEGDWDIFDQAAQRYREVLGERGLEIYRRLAAEAWSDIPALRPGERDRERFGARFRITRMMETLALVDGDLDARVEIMARDLSYPYHFLRIAELLREEGEDDRALEWAERGLAECTRRDWRLTSFVADAYQRRGQGDRAVSLLWEEFERDPCLDRYEALRRHAEPANAWPECRERAIGLLRDEPDRSELVRVLLSEGGVDAAWEEAVEGGCTEDLWFRLAEERADGHPADAIPIFQRAVQRAIDRKNKRGYREAVELMKEVKELMRRAEGPEAFRDYVEAVRNEHRRKRNLMALLDARFDRNEE